MLRDAVAPTRLAQAVPAGQAPALNVLTAKGGLVCKEFMGGIRTGRFLSVSGHIAMADGSYKFFELPSRGRGAIALRLLGGSLVGRGKRG